MKNGIYIHRHIKEYVEKDVYLGDIMLDVKETANSYILLLIKNDVKYDAPQIDDMFFKKEKVIIKKSGSEHALNDWQDGSFTLYPYRVGVPYLFSYCGSEVTEE